MSCFVGAEVACYEEQGSLLTAGSVDSVRSVRHNRMRSSEHNGHATFIGGMPRLGAGAFTEVNKCNG